ncbi:MAG: tetratricopeptide repeat protein [Verrucomicrobiota bacterium]|nr:tetratricopeptide repeat protein [Verrucomicrobiota bacterium]
MNPMCVLPRGSKWRVLIVSVSIAAGCTTALALSPPASDFAESADLLPEPPMAVEKDLVLAKEGDRKSEALASFVEGFVAENDGDIEGSLEHYRHVLDYDASNTELAIKVAYELARRGDVSEGINILKDAVKATPRDPLPYLYLSQLYSRFLKKPDLATKYASQAVEIDPANLAACLALFELYATNNQLKKAEQLLDRIAISPAGDAQFWVQVGEIYERVFLQDDGTTTPDKLKKMNVVFQKAQALANDDPVVIGKIADYYLLSRQVKEAVPLYLAVIDAKQDSPDASLANVRDKLARSLLVGGQRDEAIGVLQQMVKESPFRFEGYELLGQLFQEKGDIEQSLANYEQALLISAKPINYLRVAEMLLRSKKAERAVATLEEARRKFPDLPQITYSLAIALSQAKKHQEAMTVFEETLHESELSENNVVNGEFYFSYGAAAEQAGLADKAAGLLKKSIELDPAHAAQAENYLGYMWVDRGENLDEAGKLIQHAVAAEPENGAYLDSLGWYFFKSGETERALEQLLKAAQNTKPEDPAVYDHIGDTYSKLGNSAQALEFWQKSATLDHDNKSVAEKIENAKQKVTANPSPQLAPQ